MIDFERSNSYDFGLAVSILNWTDPHQFSTIQELFSRSTAYCIFLCISLNSAYFPSYSSHNKNSIWLSIHCINMYNISDQQHRWKISMTTQLCTGFDFMLWCNTIHTFVGTERNNSQPETDGSLSLLMSFHHSTTSLPWMDTGVSQQVFSIFLHFFCL